MCRRLTCPVHNPIARRRYRKFVADVDAAGHAEYFRLRRLEADNERRDRQGAALLRAFGASEQTIARQAPSRWDALGNSGPW